MISSALLVAVTSTLVAAQTSTVVNLMLPAVDPQDLVASVIDASPAITTYAVECADEKKDGADCGLLHAQTVAQGPSTWSIHYSHSDADFGSYEQDMWCDIDRRKDTILCTVSMVEEYDGTTDTTTTTAATTGIANLFIPVTVTAGLDKLDVAPGATSDVAAATETGDSEASTTADSASPTDSDEEAEPTTTNESEPTTTAADDDASTEDDSQPITSLFTSTTSSPSTPTTTPTTTDADNAAFPKATQNAFLVGAAVVVGGVMML